MSGETMAENMDVEFLSVPMLRTRIAEDIVPADKHHAWFAQMGMLPGSDDVAAMEKAAGDERRGNLRTILPSIDLFTAVASDLMQKAILLHDGKPIDAAYAVPLGTLALTNLAVTRAVIGQMLDLGILKIGGITVEGTMG